MKLSAAILFLTASVGNSSEYLALRGQKRRATATTPFGFEDEGDADDVHVELPTPDMGKAEVDEEGFPVPDVYSRSEEVGSLEETGEGDAEAEDDGTTEGGGGPNEPGYKEGMEPPDLNEEPEGPSPCESLGANPDPEGQAYADCMAKEDENQKEDPVEEDPVEEDPVEESIQYGTESEIAQLITLDEGMVDDGDKDSGGDMIMKPLLPSESKVLTKTITLEYADGTKTTVMETFPEPTVPTESPVANPDPSV